MNDDRAWPVRVLIEMSLSWNEYLWSLEDFILRCFLFYQISKVEICLVPNWVKYDLRFQPESFFDSNLKK